MNFYQGHVKFVFNFIVACHGAYIRVDSSEQVWFRSMEAASIFLQKTKYFFGINLSKNSYSKRTILQFSCVLGDSILMIYLNSSWYD